MFTVKQLKKSADFEAYKEIRLYGVIEFDHEWQADNSFFRRMEIKHLGVTWKFYLRDGDLLSFGWNEE